MLISNLISNRQIFSSVLLCLICLTGDWLVQYVHKSASGKAIFDNLTHALVGLISACIIIDQFTNKLSSNDQVFLVLACFIFASLIDVDHFIEAKSFHIKDATNLTHRPFLHCSNIPFIIFLGLLLAKNYRSFQLNIWICILFCAFASHHTRDATRRGYWFLPYGNTPPIPYFVYIGLTLVIPFFIIYLLCKFQTETPILHVGEYTNV